MRRTLLAALAALALLLVAGVSPAHAQVQTWHFKFKGLDAFAVYSTVDSSGCVYTDVLLYGVDGRVKFGPGKPDAESAAVAIVDRYDACADKELLGAFGYATLTPGQFQIDSQLNEASLTATIELYDYVSDTSFPVSVDMDWVGHGDKVTVKDHFQMKSSGFKLNYKFSGTFRESTTAGAVSDGTTNFTPEPAVYADMGSLKEGEIAVARN